MSLALRTLSLLLSLTADTTAFRHAAARRGCTQEDAPALELLLSDVRYDGIGEGPATPYVRVEVEWNAWQRANGGPLALVPLRRSEADRAKLLVRAELHERAGTATWLRGTIRLERVTVGREVVGSYDFGGRAGRFTATWVDGHGGCG